MAKIDDEMRAARAAVVLTRKRLGKSALDPRVMAALGQVPRHAFVPENHRSTAYENRPQPIGHGQTISQPYMVAVMTDLAAIAPGDRVLEIGTGCGYQTAVLAELAARVYTVEVVPELANRAAELLRGLGYGNIDFHVGDGALGWPEQAPFAAIVVTAAAWHRVPPTLIDQLTPGGRLVIPVDRSKTAARYPFASQAQDLLLVTKDQAGAVTERNVLPVAFVPLVEGGETPDSPTGQ
jgi:protein-L-isoaspartate(D-aspartate) O-methyltransferase